MTRQATLTIGLLAATLLLLADTSQAQPTDPGVRAAISLLDDATTPQRDAGHNAMLLGLRRLDDPALLPLFAGLSNSPYLTMRIHGRLGAAALSPRRQIDLALLAEVKDQRELVQVLSAAIDDGLIAKDAMATLLSWDGLDLPLRQAVALRLLAKGEPVGVEAYDSSLDVKLDEDVSAGRFLQYAIAAMIMSEQGDGRGLASLNLLSGVSHAASEAVLGQVFETAMRHGFTSVGALALTVAKDADRSAALRLLALQSALRLGADGATAAWRTAFLDEQSSAQRIRLAMIALDAADAVPASLFDTLDDQGQWIGHIAGAGRALANNNDDLAAAFAPLIATGQPLSVRWVITYCQRTQPKQGPALLALIAKHHDAGPRHHRAAMTQAAIDAAAALCEVYPEQAGDPLAALLVETRDDQLALRQVTLMGIASARSDLTALAASIQPDTHNDFTTRALRLFIRARHDAPLTDADWQQVSDIVQGVGELSPAMRLQLGWAYLKHQGQADAAINQALR